MAFNPLAAMLGGAFTPYASPLPPEPEPGVSPMLPAMLARDDLFAPQEATTPDAASYLPPDMDPQGASPQDADLEALYARYLEPVRKDPSLKQRLITSAVPIIAAAIAGKTGGYSAAAGALAGWNKSQSDNAALDLERSKLDAVRRERALARDMKLMDQRQQTVKDRTAAVEKLLDTAMKLKTPAIARAYLDGVQRDYAHLGVDTTKLWRTVEPGLVRQAQEDAAEAWRKAITSQADLARASGQDVDPEDLLDADVTYDGVKMTMRDLAKLGAIPVSEHSLFRQSAKDEFSIESEIQAAITDREKEIGEPLDYEARAEIALEVRSARKNAERDPVVAELNLERLKALRRKNAEAEGDGAAGAGSGFKKTVYTTLQERQRVQLHKSYVDQSKDFAGRARAWDTVRNVAERARAGNKASQRALIYNIYKMWDPNSAVLPGEYASLQDAADVPDRIRNWVGITLKQQTLTRQQIDEMFNEAQGAYESYRAMHDDVAMEAAQNAIRFGIDPWDVIRDYNARDGRMNLPGIPKPGQWAILNGKVVKPEDAEPAPPPSRTPTVDFGTAGRRQGLGVGQTPTLDISPPPAAPPPVVTGAPARVVKDQIIIYNGKPRKVKTVNADGVTGIELYPE